MFPSNPEVDVCAQYASRHSTEPTHHDSKQLAGGQVLDVRLDQQWGFRLTDEDVACEDDVFNENI